MDDNGFFSKIGYVMKVLESNRKAKAVRCETRGIIWACLVLKQNLNLLSRKYPRYANEFNQIYHPYYEQIRNLHEVVMDEILSNKITNGNKQEEADNSN